MSKPTDESLYNKVKTEVDQSYTKPSAYRSMAYTRFYMKAFKEKYGENKTAYKGKKPGDLKEWRNEKWVDVKSFVENPKNPTACGNEPYKKGEYPLCMPVKEAGKYSEGELRLLMKRKSEIGSKRLVKDSYLRDVLKPEEIPRSRIYKQKYIKDKKLRIPEPVPEKEAEKILKEKPLGRKSMEQKVEIPVFEEEKPRRARGRPRLSDEQRDINKQASLEKRKESRRLVKEENQKKREEIRKAKEEERAKAKAEALANKPPRQTRTEKSKDIYQGIVIDRTPYKVSFD